MTVAIAVHGGAGAWDLTSPRLPQAVSACREAAAIGQKHLLASGSALDAVELAVRLLEDCPVLDAGRGSYLNAAGAVEMDALIMDGQTLDLGAVAAIQFVRYPITLARRVMDQSEHALLVGAGASAFADSIGFPRCTIEALLVDRELAEYRRLQSLDAYETSDVFVEPNSMDTVGAVAVDQHGNVAVATSTGGTRKKLPGRVGDSPLVGSGGYADNVSGAVSATGHGEALMKVVISKRVCDLMEGGATAQAACEQAIALLQQRVNGVGGVVAVDREGRIGRFFNTVAMPHAWATNADPVQAAH